MHGGQVLKIMVEHVDLQSTFLFFGLQSTFFFRSKIIHFSFSVFNPHFSFRGLQPTFLFFGLYNQHSSFIFGRQTTFLKAD